MTDENIQELISIINSIELSKKNYNNSYETLDFVVARCENFCKQHNINITHGSAYKELKHKSYYYKDKYINNLLANKSDLYNLYTNNILSGNEIVERIFRKEK